MTGADQVVNVSVLELGRAPNHISNVAQKYKAGDHVSWNSEAGRVRGRIVRVRHKNLNWKDYVRRVSVDEPQYEIKSDKTEHVALDRGRALRRLGR
jgi:hypothetical protein